MAKSLSQGFTEFLGHLTPTATEQQAAALHRESVEGALNSGLSVNRFRQTGSFHHGTGIRGHADVDLLVSLGIVRPTTSWASLSAVKCALEARFPNTPLYISRPAVVLDFGRGTERWEVIPAYITGRGGPDQYVYDIPSPTSGGGWIDTAPDEHLRYVNASNDRPAVKGGAKALTQFLKAWKYYAGVPISSFYLEMFAARHMNGESSFVPHIDLLLAMSKMWDGDLPGIPDPSRASGTIQACSTPDGQAIALDMLLSAYSCAKLAQEEHSAGNDVKAFSYLNMLYKSKFPAP